MERPELAAEVGRTWARPIVLVPLFALIALVAGALPSFSLAANLLVLCTGGALFWLGMSHHVPRRQSPRRLTAGALWWFVPFTLLIGVEVATFLIGSNQAYPTLSKLFDPILEGYLARAALYYGWLAVFWGLVRR
jgi:hypothetical protein